MPAARSARQIKKGLRARQQKAQEAFAAIVEDKCEKCIRFQTEPYYCDKWKNEVRFGFRSIYEATGACRASYLIIKNCQDFVERKKNGD